MKFGILITIALFLLNTLNANTIRTFTSTSSGNWDEAIWKDENGNQGTPTFTDHVIINHEVILDASEEGFYIHKGNVSIEATGTFLINTGKGGQNAFIFQGSMFEVKGALITSDDFSHQKDVPGGEGIFYAHSNATVYIGDDFEPFEKSLTINDVQCFIMGDDLKFWGDQSKFTGTGSICVGPVTNIPGTWSGEVRAIVNGVHTDGFDYIDRNIPVYRIDEFGNTCSIYIDNGHGDFTLPVELGDFYGDQVNESVMLNWATLSELNNNYFLVERSEDGMQFEAIGRIEGAGTTTEITEYSFQDKTPFAGPNYYRLKQIDLDGAINYSSLIEVRVELKEEIEFTAYPVPSYSSPISYKLSKLESHETVIISVYSINGKLISKKKVNADTNGRLEGVLHEIQSPGSYILNYVSNSSSDAKVLIKY